MRSLRVRARERVRACHHAVHTHCCCCAQWAVEDEGEGTSLSSQDRRFGPGHVIAMLLHKVDEGEGKARACPHRVCHIVASLG